MAQPKSQSSKASHQQRVTWEAADHLQEGSEKKETGLMKKLEMANPCKEGESRSVYRKRILVKLKEALKQK
jgi:hypothetical protein